MERLGIRLPADQKDTLAAMAKQEDTTISCIVREMIKNTLSTPSPLCGSWVEQEKERVEE